MITMRLVCSALDNLNLEVFRFSMILLSESDSSLTASGSLRLSPEAQLEVPGSHCIQVQLVLIWIVFLQVVVCCCTTESRMFQIWSTGGLLTLSDNACLGTESTPRIAAFSVSSWVSSMARVVRLAALLAACVVLSHACSQDTDCNLNGLCSSGYCLCNTGWVGPTCNTLNLGPVNPQVQLLVAPCCRPTLTCCVSLVQLHYGLMLCWVMSVRCLFDGCDVSDGTCGTRCRKCGTDRPPLRTVRSRPMY